MSDIGKCSVNILNQPECCQFCLHDLVHLHPRDNWTILLGIVSVQARLVNYHLIVTNRLQTLWQQLAMFATPRALPLPLSPPPSTTLWQPSTTSSFQQDPAAEITIYVSLAYKLTFMATNTTCIKLLNFGFSSKGVLKLSVYLWDSNHVGLRNKFNPREQDKLSKHFKGRSGLSVRKSLLDKPKQQERIHWPKLV